MATSFVIVTNNPKIPAFFNRSPFLAPDVSSTIATCIEVAMEGQHRGQFSSQNAQFPMLVVVDWRFVFPHCSPTIPPRFMHCSLIVCSLFVHDSPLVHPIPPLFPHYSSTAHPILPLPWPPPFFHHPQFGELFCLRQPSPGVAMKGIFLSN